MIDPGLLGTVMIMVVWMALTVRFVSSSVVDRHRLVDLVTGPLVVGFVVARLAAMAAEDFGESLHLRDLALIRSGMEFWAGLAAGLGWAAWRWRDERPGIWPVFAAITPFGLWAYSLFEATCLVRDGCLGPVSQIGLRPHGLQSRVFPVGLAVAVVLSIVGTVLHRAWSLDALTVVFSGLTALAVVRAMAGIWLPAIGASRVERESVLAALVIPLVWVFWAVRRRRANRFSEVPESDASPSPSVHAVVLRERTLSVGADVANQSDEMMELHHPTSDVQRQQEQSGGGYSSRA